MLTVIRILLLIIGWTLLILFGLLLLLLLLLLFTPIPYRVRLNGDPDRKPVFEVSVSVFGLQLYPKKERKRRRHIKNRKKNKNQNQEKQTADTSGDGLSETSEDTGITSKAAAPDTGAGQTESESQTPEAAADGHTEKTKRRNQKPEAKRNAKGTAALAGIRSVFQELSDTGNKQALQHMLREVCYILRHFGPRQVRADAAFSLGDPANTGYATAGLSLCPFAYGRHCVITPDFQSERVYFYGRAELRGHVRLIHAACAGIRLLADRQIRRLLRKLRT